MRHDIAFGLLIGVAGLFAGVVLMVAPEYLHLPQWADAIVFWGGTAITIICLTMAISLGRLIKETPRKLDRKKLIISTIFGAIFIFVGVWIIWRGVALLPSSTEKQLQTEQITEKGIADSVVSKLEERNRSSQRAWLTLIPRLVSEIKLGAPIDIDLIAENVGKEPATGIKSYGMAMMFDMPVQIEYAPQIWTAQFAEVIAMGCELAIPENGRPIVFPGQKIVIPIRWEHIEGISELISSKKILVMYGCTGYLTLGNEHRTTYCLFLMRDKKSGRWQLSPAPIGNGVT